MIYFFLKLEDRKYFGWLCLKNVCFFFPFKSESSQSSYINICFTVRQKKKSTRGKIIFFFHFGTWLYSQFFHESIKQWLQRIFPLAVSRALDRMSRPSASSLELANTVRSQEWGPSLVSPCAQYLVLSAPTVTTCHSQYATPNFVKIHTVFSMFFFASLSFDLCNFKCFYHGVHRKREKEKIKKHQSMYPQLQQWCAWAGVAL